MPQIRCRRDNKRGCCSIHTAASGLLRLHCPNARTLVVQAIGKAMHGIQAVHVCRSQEPEPLRNHGLAEFKDLGSIGLVVFCVGAHIYWSLNNTVWFIKTSYIAHLHSTNHFAQNTKPHKQTQTHQCQQAARYTLQCAPDISRQLARWCMPFSVCTSLMPC